MTPTPHCSQCGSESTDTRHRGLCPRCLLGLGLSDSDPVAGLEGLETRSMGPTEGTPPPASFTGPRRIAGYEILRQLGAGGMGTVFEAFEEKMDRRVALKVLSVRLDGSSDANRRFEQEAWIAGRLDHPNVVKVFERGTAEGHSYYSMELVEGGSLHDVLGNLKRWGRDDTWRLEFGSKRYIDWAIDQVITAARALDYAHRHGVVHRDIKPMNLLLSRENGALKIVDFGVALDSEASRLTATGDVMGTLTYMAPEQLLGKRDEIGVRADVYSLGVTLFEMLTLDLPHNSETREAYMHSVLHSAARRARTLNQRVGRDLETVIGRALERSPRDRYPSAAAFADDLDRVRHLAPIQARRPGSLERLWKWARRRPVHAALAATLIVATPLTAILGTRAVQHRRLVRTQSIGALEQRILFLSQRESFPDIVGAADRLLDIDATNAIALRGRGIASLELALADDANRARLESAALQDMESLVALRPTSSGAHRLQQYVLERLGRTELAREAGDRAERLRSAVPSDEDLQAEGFVACQTGDYTLAVETLSELITRSPQRLQALELRAHAWEKLGRLDKAIEDYRVFASISPELFRGRFELGRLNTAIGEFHLGETHFLEALKIKPLEALAHDGLAHNAIKRSWEALESGEDGQAREILLTAEAHARRSIELDPDLPRPHMNLGVILMELDGLLESDPERVAEAARHYERAALLLVERTETDGLAYADVQVNLCDLSIELGEYDRALATCGEVIRRRPDDPTAYYNVAAIHALNGRADEALAALERDLALGDTDHAYLESDPWFDALRGDARFEDLLRRMRSAAQAN